VIPPPRAELSSTSRVVFQLDARRQALLLSELGEVGQEPRTRRRSREPPPSQMQRELPGR
jgi:hypothetical protein